MKSVPNLISYLHEFFQNFSQSLAICFELFSFGEFVYSEIADSGPHLSGAARHAVAAWLPRAARLARALRRCQDSVPRVPTTRLTPTRQRPAFRVTVVADSAPPRARRRLDCLLADRLLTRAAAVRHPRADEPPLLVRFPRTGAVPPPARRAAPPCAARAMCRALRWPAGLGRARCAGRGQAGPRSTRPWAAHSWLRVAPALHDWAERDFGPVAPG
jgi:hypothetical protein